jgi:nitrite reductase (NADH) large subunit
MKNHVILGNGGAAISAVKALRSIDFDDEVTIISREGGPAYSPVLTTDYLAGSIDYQATFICDDSFYQQNKVSTLFGKNVIKIDTGIKKVSTDSGEVLKYDNLLIASGSSPVVPSMAGVNLPGVFTLYSGNDAQEIMAFLAEKETVAVIGSGLIGMQVLQALVTRGKSVVLVEMMAQILPQILNQEGARLLEERLRQKGVDIHLSETVSSIRGNGGGKKVLQLASGAQATVDAVILAVGVRPNVDFLKNSGLELNTGIIVDEYCRTSIDGVWAAGDVAEAVDPVSGQPAINATWPSAVEQGRVAGLNMAGQKASIQHNLRFNVLNLFDSTCVSIGLIGTEGTKLDEVGWQDEGNYRKLFFKDGLFVGAVLLGETEDAGIIASLIERRTLFPDLYEALRSRRVLAHSIKDYYWSTLLNTIRKGVADFGYYL